MKVMSKKTKLSAEKVIQKAKDYFEDELGLEVQNGSAECCIEFRSNLGFVIVEAIGENQEREVKVTTREYEYQIQEFLKEVK
jgi:hypothetical protein